MHLLPLTLVILLPSLTLSGPISGRDGEVKVLHPSSPSSLIRSPSSSEVSHASARSNSQVKAPPNPLTGLSSLSLSTMQEEQYKHCRVYLQKRFSLSYTPSLHKAEDYSGATSPSIRTLALIQKTIKALRLHTLSTAMKTKERNDLYSRVKSLVSEWEPTLSRHHLFSSSTSSPLEGAMVYSCWWGASHDIKPVSLVPLPTKKGAWVRNLSTFLLASTLNPKLFVTALDFIALHKTPVLVVEPLGPSLQADFSKSPQKRPDESNQAESMCQKYFPQNDSMSKAYHTALCQRMLSFLSEFSKHMGILVDARRKGIPDWGFGLDSIYEVPGDGYEMFQDKFGPSMRDFAPDRKTMYQETKNLMIAVIYRDFISSTMTTHLFPQALSLLDPVERENMKHAMQGLETHDITEVMQRLANKRREAQGTLSLRGRSLPLAPSETPEARDKRLKQHNDEVHDQYKRYNIVGRQPPSVRVRRIPQSQSSPMILDQSSHLGFRSKKPESLLARTVNDVKELWKGSPSVISPTFRRASGLFSSPPSPSSSSSSSSSSSILRSAVSFPKSQASLSSPLAVTTSPQGIKSSSSLSYSTTPPSDLLDPSSRHLPPAKPIRKNARAKAHSSSSQEETQDSVFDEHRDKSYKIQSPLNDPSFHDLMRRPTRNQ
ncbi:MAG: hypothetical protein DHS80DRAFT_25210 [Piptocephalis tieghemiana]|nr:MAG: hypothetical protein DHS80DRAFT_25210 [Piptocephalis tieghemiana]